MKLQGSGGTRFSLTAASVGVSVDVHVRPVGERWVVSAVFDGRREHGIAARPALALAAALSPLGDRARAELMADLALIGPSCDILEDAATAGR